MTCVPFLKHCFETAGSCLINSTLKLAVSATVFQSILLKLERPAVEISLSPNSQESTLRFQKHVDARVSCIKLPACLRFRGQR